MSVPAPPSNVTASVDSDDQITVSWDYDPTWFAFDGDDGTLGGFDEGRWFSSSGSVDNFKIQVTRDGLGWTDLTGGNNTPTYDGSKTYSESFGPSGDDSFSSQIGIDSMFKFRVQAVNTDGGSNWANSGKVYTSPLPPIDANLSRPQRNSIKLTQTVQSDILDYTLVYLREDTGNGFGNWELAELMSSETKGNRVSVTMDTENDMRYRGPLTEDARYQFKCRTRTPNNPEGSRENSEDLYADFGDQDDLFRDGFESGDVSNWDASNGGHSVGDGTHGDTGVSGPKVGSFYFKGTGSSDTGATWIQKNFGDLTKKNHLVVISKVAIGSLDGSAENFNIEWYDGSSWQELTAWTWEYNEQGWFEVTSLVPNSWLSTDNRLRMGSTSGTGMYGGDHFALDEVVVKNLTPPVDWTRETSSYSTSASSTTDTIINLNANAESWSRSGSSTATRIADLLRQSTSHFTSANSTAQRSGIAFEGRTIESHSASANSYVTTIIDLNVEPSSHTAISSASATRGSMNLATRTADSYALPTTSLATALIDVSYGVESHSEQIRSFVYNDRTSLELIDQKINWNDNGSFWYTDWFQETKLRDEEDTLAIRSQVVDDAKEPCAIVRLQYDANGDGQIDAESEPVKLGRDQEVKEVYGIPVSEDGWYRIKITEYSGYNSLYALDTAIVH